MQGDAKRANGDDARSAQGSGDAEATAPDAPAGESRTSAEEGAEVKAELARVRETLLRTAADFDNYRKRTRREVDDARRGGKEDLLKVLLPVFDNLERAIQSAQRSTDVKAMTEGLAMVQRQFVDALGREGIARVATVGTPFDPGVHEAIQQVETADHPAGTIIAEVQPGYTQGDRLIRAAMVVVARAKTVDGAEAERQGDVS